jgi:hypothetical protein
MKYCLIGKKVDDGEIKIIPLVINLSRLISKYIFKCKFEYEFESDTLQDGTI